MNCIVAMRDGIRERLEHRGEMELRDVAAPQVCAARAAAGAPSARCTPPASSPRPASRSSASPFPHGCCLPQPLHLSCSSPCDGQPSASRRRGAVPPCLRRHGLPAPETGYPPLSSPPLLPLSQAHARPRPPTPRSKSAGCSSCSFSGRPVMGVISYFRQPSRAERISARFRSCRSALIN